MAMYDFAPVEDVIDDRRHMVREPRCKEVVGHLYLVSVPRLGVFA
jgi:hypothetical protein